MAEQKQNLINVASQIRKGVKQLEWLVNLSKALEDLGSLEQAEREMQKRYDALRKNVEDFDAKLAKRHKDLEEACIAADDRVFTADKKAKSIIADAEIYATKTHEDAIAQKASIVTGANHELISARSEASRIIDAALSEVKAAKEEALGLRDEAGQRRAELDEYLDKIEQAKAKARSMFD